MQLAPKSVSRTATERRRRTAGGWFLQREKVSQLRGAETHKAKVISSIKSEQELP
jgi:hypothetical protein